MHDNNSAILSAAHDRGFEYSNSGGTRPNRLRDEAKNYDSEIALDPPSISIEVSLDASAKSFVATIDFSHPLLPKSGGSPFFQVDSGVMIAFTVDGNDPLWELKEAGIVDTTRGSSGGGGDGSGGGRDSKGGFKSENGSKLSALSAGKTGRSNVSPEEARETRGAADDLTLKWAGGRTEAAAIGRAVCPDKACRL